MKRLLWMVLALPLMMACQQKKERQEVPEPVWQEEDDFVEEGGIQGTILRLDGDRVFLLTDGGDSITFSLSQALADDRVYGGYHLNDQVVVIPGAGNSALELLNVTALKGTWMARDAEGQEMGLVMSDEGECQPLTPTSLHYQKWSLWGDHLVLTYQDSISQRIVRDTCEVRAFKGDTLKFASSYETAPEQVFFRPRQKMSRSLGGTK